MAESWVRLGRHDSRPEVAGDRAPVRATGVTPRQFATLAELLRLRGGASQECARLVLVEGMTVPDAAAQTGLGLRAAYNAAQRVRLAHEAIIRAYCTDSGAKSA